METHIEFEDMLTRVAFFHLLIFYISFCQKKEIYISFVLGLLFFSSRIM